jgi:hypothetical protein
MIPRQEGYCIHGTYVGGCGIDHMCGRCEDGDPGPQNFLAEYVEVQVVEDQEVMVIICTDLDTGEKTVKQFWLQKGQTFGYAPSIEEV